jgi:hypothetical protein
MLKQKVNKFADVLVSPMGTRASFSLGSFFGLALGWRRWGDYEQWGGGHHSVGV